MQAGQLQVANFNVGHIDPSSLMGRIGSLMARVFGCWHAELSRPFSRQGHAYVACLNCGAQRQFNLGNWKMQGKFYYSQPSVSN